MNEKRIAQLVVEFLLADATGMVKSEDKEKKEEATGKSEGKGIKSLSDIFKQFEMKLFGLLAPAALVATILASTASGLSVFIGAIKIVGNTLGMLLAPGILFASAVLISLAQIIEEAVVPNLEEWATFIVNNGIQAIDWMGEAIVKTINWLSEFGDGLQNATINIAKDAAMLGYTISILADEMAQLIKRTTGAFANRNTVQMLEGVSKASRSRADIISAGATFSNENHIVKRAWVSMMDDLKDSMKNSPFQNFSGRVLENLKVVNQQFRMENMPKASSTSLSQAYFSAQMATLQMTPYERQSLKDNARVADTMDKILAKITPTTN